MKPKFKRLSGEQANSIFVMVDAIGELISNMCRALEVHQLMKKGMPEKDAANTFMKNTVIY